MTTFNLIIDIITLILIIVWGGRHIWRMKLFLNENKKEIKNIEITSYKERGELRH